MSTILEAIQEAREKLNRRLAPLGLEVRELTLEDLEALAAKPERRPGAGVLKCACSADLDIDALDAGTCRACGRPSY